jgi:hypothetical protein
MRPVLSESSRWAQPEHHTHTRLVRRLPVFSIQEESCSVNPTSARPQQTQIIEHDLIVPTYFGRQAHALDERHASAGRWCLGGSQRSLTAGITSFQYLHEHLPAVVPYADTTINSWASPTEFNFVVAAQLQGQASVGLAGSDSCLSCRPRAGPHRHQGWNSGAEVTVLALHLRDAFTDSKPAQDSPYGPHATGAPRRCTSRAARRALPPLKGAAPDLQRRQGRFDERLMHVRNDTLRAELDRRTCQLQCGACARACPAHSILSPAPTPLARVWCGRGWPLCVDKRGLGGRAYKRKVRPKAGTTAVPARAHDLDEALGEPSLSSGTQPMQGALSAEAQGGTCALVGDYSARTSAFCALWSRGIKQRGDSSAAALSAPVSVCAHVRPVGSCLPHGLRWRPHVLDDHLRHHLHGDRPRPAANKRTNNAPRSSTAERTCSSPSPCHA